MLKGLFGGGGKDDGEGDFESAGDEQKGGGDGGGYGGGGGLGFDPRGLERAAKAAKQLDSSPNARSALDLVKEQERTKQADSNAKAAEMNAYAKQLEIKRLHEQSEEQRKTLEAQSQKQQQLEQYKDQLERKRQNDALKQQISAQQYLKEEERRKDEEAVSRQEAMRRKTLEYEAELRRSTELAKVKAEAEGRILQERKNQDIRMSELRTSAREYRRTVIEAIRAAGSTIGTGFSEFISDREKLTASVLTLTGLAFGFYAAKVGTGVTGRYVESVLGKPSLIRETSRTSPLDIVRRPVGFVRSLSRTSRPDSALEGLVLKEDLDKNLRRIAVSAANTRKNSAPFRNVLLQGPPGTGKTHFAKGLARYSGLEYAIFTGGDIAPLGKDAVTEIHKIFEWAKRSRKGLLLFLDEADAFLRRRSTERISEDLRSALNAFLFRTGEPSDRFMLVYASNQPEQFDWAANDRIDEIVTFDLPGREERLRMIKYYFKKYVEAAASGATTRIKLDGISEEHFVEAAKRTEGFSGREIAKLGIAWQSAGYGTNEAKMTPDLYMMVLDAQVRQKLLKSEWRVAAEGTASHRQEAVAST
eukprot:CAMPEP_0113967572 /NCGR_PEP_ID=MMETSP0011_2-20120614/9016_1 /TAXON_ID=101924 /ORGANISM="Rhodosorus marinus" /LENGTH=586 /DNA_ID=CAMNT_0000980493 /DNA_START=269 /DNA_END=2029 /DNA_ORIENTATION=- /assembly_acc=CAM_ASM_000156